ncbi:MAG: Asp-tRNA(Asn)/Glu-tRNA(Gln) amidotransferase subunit GatB [Bacteroidetes bacterium]|nr:Asp-tRNA(Asn)/Glu-tRNA(Gln) amidotransferase subunit GatB [Bacteroidota bacterium]
MNHPKYEAVIGLEVHAQLSTKTKIFCGCSTKFGAAPNSQVCPVCLGMPGVLPVLNEKVVEYVIRMGLAHGCDIAERSTFARKNYFYPDLPKGYQISQYEDPICANGSVQFKLEDGTEKSVRLMRIHMEEDAGKSLHDQHQDTFVDLNRAGTPLIEIVSQPDIKTAEEAGAYLTKLRQAVRYLEICDGNMEEGSLRCDANVSVMLRGSKEFGTRTELKNLNSIKFVEKAIDAEIARQIEIIEDGGKIIQSTMGYDPHRNETRVLRTKENAHDYRYFPDPDLVMVHVTEDRITKVRNEMPELPDQKKNRLVSQYGIPVYDAEVLSADKELANYYESVCKETTDFKAASNWVMGEVMRIMKEKLLSISEFSLSPVQIAGIVNLIKDGKISTTIGKQLFEELLANGGDPATVVEAKGWLQVSDTGAIESVIDTVIASNPGQVAEFVGGKDKLFGFFVGQTMKAMKGQGNPKVINDILVKKLEALKS